MKAIEFKSLCVGLCVGAAVVFALGAVETPKPVEYKVISGQIWAGEFQNKLNETAAEGWQLQNSGTFAERYGFAILTRNMR
jgi:hypothetical protein